MNEMSLYKTFLTESSVLTTSPQDHEQNLPEAKSSHLISTKGFAIKNLPFELRRIIYIQHLSTNPSLSINALNAALPLHKTHALHSSSPYFDHEIPASLYHAHQTFTFTSGTTMRQFSVLYNRQHEVKKIRIILKSPDDGKGRYRDWIWLIQECFSNLADIELVLPAVDGERDEKVCGQGNGIYTKGWWSCVEDAFRESMGYRTIEWELVAGQGFRKKFPRLSVVDGEGTSMCWSEYGGKGKRNDVGCLL